MHYGRRKARTVFRYLGTVTSAEGIDGERVVRKNAMRCFAAFAVRDQRGGGAPTASSAEGNSPVSIASISRKYLWFGKPQLRDSGVTVRSAIISRKNPREP